MVLLVMGFNGYRYYYGYRYRYRPFRNICIRILVFPFVSVGSVLTDTGPVKVSVFEYGIFCLFLYSDICLYLYLYPTRCVPYLIVSIFVSVFNYSLVSYNKINLAFACEHSRTTQKAMHGLSHKVMAVEKL